MALVINAKFKNGVFVPDKPPMLSDDENVRLVVDRQESIAGQDRAALLNMIDQRASNPIRLDPAVVRMIAEDPEFNIENW